MNNMKHTNLLTTEEMFNSTVEVFTILIIVATFPLWVLPYLIYKYFN